MAIARSQEASSSTSPCIYHVFLSFRGEDTRKTFADHLYTALVHAGFRTFRDDDELERGENIESELQRAIQESKISIVVFSKNYASSRWCLDELVMILERKRTTKHKVLPVFYDVDPSQARNQKGSFKKAFLRHEARFKAEAGERKNEWQDKVKGWRAALKEVADLAGMNLQNQADGHESRFIEKIVRVVGDKSSRTILGTAPHLIGLHSRSTNVQLWLEDGSTGVIAICGMGGIGKTTIAKFLYNFNFSRFEGCSFLANVREISKQQDGLIRLQEQLLSDILQGRKEKIYSVDEGIVKIQNAIGWKRILIVLDDVDELDQLEAVLGMRDWLFPGSKIIITTRFERLLRAHEDCKVHKVEKLNNNESLELFSWYAFGQDCPSDDHMDDSKRVVHYCGGLPLAIKVLGSSLSGRSIDVWKSQLEKLKAIPDNEIIEKLKTSYDSLQDLHDKNLFLHVSCFFVGKDKDCTVAILDGCDFYTMVGIQNLIDRCLLTIDKSNNLEMHQLLQAMGREIVCQESPEPGKRSRLWNPKESLNVLRGNTGTSKIEGLILDMHLLKKDKSATTIVGVNRKRCFEEFQDKSLLSSVGNPIKRNRFGISLWHLVGTAPKNSNHVALEADAFASMCNLKLLQVSNVQLNGSYKMFPKGLRWLLWHGFPLQSTPIDFPMDGLVVLEMPNSSLKKVWDKSKFLEFLKILNLSHSHSLAETPDFSMLPNLERLILKNCTRLLEIHESIGYLERLVLLNLRDCKNLRMLPRSISTLKVLETLDISGCSNLHTSLGSMESLTVLRADGIAVDQLLSTTGKVNAQPSFIWSWLLKPRKSPEYSWASLPRSLVRLSLGHCNLSDDAFPMEFSNLSSLQELNLSNNPICSLPDCIRGLTGLQILQLESCPMLRSLVRLPKLEKLSVGGSRLLEKITYLSRRPRCIHYGQNDSLGEIMGYFKLEPIGNVDAEIINNLGLSNLGSIEKTNVKLRKPFNLYAEGTKLPLQGCHGRHIFYAYLPGSEVPRWFNMKNRGSSISFTVPSSHDDNDDDLNSRIRSLSVCSVYALCNNSVSDDRKYKSSLHTIISNTTKSMKWTHIPCVFGFPKDHEDMMIMLSYWKFENQLEAGDELDISVVSEDFQVKEVGVHLVTQSSSTSEEEVQQQQFHPYGNVVPGNASAHPASKKVYRLGWCLKDGCKYCYDGDLIKRINNAAQ